MRCFTISPRRQRRSECRDERRLGNILVLAAAVMTMVMGFTAFVIDGGYITLTKAHLQNAADAAALAGALELNPVADQDDIADAVRLAASDVALLNRAGDQSSVTLNGSDDIELGRRSWNADTNSFDYAWGDTATPYNIVRVTARRTIVTEVVNGVPQSTDNRLKLFFAPIFGKSHSSLQETAVATFQPRDIMLVLDYSGSMNDDSELKSISKLGREQIETNIAAMWEELGSPTYGNLSFEPEYATISGQPASGGIPHIDVTWKGTSVYVESTKNLSNVVLQFTNNSKYKFDNLNQGKTGTFAGVGSNYGREIKRVWVKSGSNSSNDGYNYGERFDFDTSDIRSALGLNNLSYPYNSGSWNDFIDYCTRNNYQPDNAGYRYQFGIMLLINYFNDRKPEASQTSDLWKISQQPLTAMKNSVELFVDYLIDAEAEDRIGLSAYTYPDNVGATLESALTHDFDAIKSISRGMQAAHYDAYTNIGAGMTVARQELVANAEAGAVRMMILITDGQANRSSTHASPDEYALDEADLAADSNIEIVTISLGTGADKSLMQAIADRTGGSHFNIPGGGTVAEYSEQLLEVFAEIAADRPLQLIRGE